MTTCGCVFVLSARVSPFQHLLMACMCALARINTNTSHALISTHTTRVCVIPLPTSPAHSPKNRNPVCWPPTWTATPGWRGLMTRSEEHSTRWNWVFFCQRANENTPHVCYAAEMNWIIGGCEFKCVFLDSNIDWYCSLIVQNILSI